MAQLPVGRVARWAREVLVELGLDPRVTTTGGRGLHVRVPIEPTAGLELRPLTLAISRMVADRHPDHLTVEMRKAGRGGRTLVDWSRSMPGATLIAPWSPRAIREVVVAVGYDLVDASPRGVTASYLDPDR